jgi:hypothetical protein
MVYALMMTAALALGAEEMPAASVESTEDHHARNRLTLGPTPLLMGWVAIEYERAISDRFSLVLGPQVRPRRLLFGLEGRGARLVLGSRFFLLGRAPHGSWLGAEIVPTYEETRPEGSTAYATSRSIVGLLTAGYTLSIGPLTGSAGVGAGAGYLDNNAPAGASDEGPFTLPTFRGLVPALSLHLNAGVTF